MEATSNTSQDTPSPRKRRRRAPATGAADDCFACQERQKKCDRRRPYCTPCLDIGKDCSGYKTALTWGVGVASRGKLRGLSLPITNSKPAAPATDDEPSKHESPPKKLTKLGPTRRESDGLDPSQITKSSAIASTAATTASTPTNYGFVNLGPTSASSATPSPSYSAQNFEWLRPLSLSHTRNIRLAYKKPRKHTLQPLHISAMHPVRDYGIMPMTASIVGGYGHHDFGLSSQISPMVPTFPGYEISAPANGVPPSSAPYDTPLFNSAHLPWADDQLTPSVSSAHGSQPSHDDLHEYFSVADGMMVSQQDMVTRTASITSVPSEQPLSVDPSFRKLAGDLPALIPDDVGDHVSHAIPPSIPTLRIGNTVNMQFLIEYYDKAISPVIVAFDGPTNPYRSHILQLAIESETLQHALAALAASNLRMRRIEDQTSAHPIFQNGDTSSHDLSVRRSLIAHSLMKGDLHCLPETLRSTPSTEELYHKALAVKGLNKQLADPTTLQDDSILASLLILCLYHTCDTGVAKFKTQFAVVKMILAFRGGTKSTNSKTINWLTIMFTWFDTMTASVNHRESRLSGDDLDTAGHNGNEWALENIAGCDSRLFELIPKLGRLNLLSQNRRIPEPSSPTSPRLPAQPLSNPSRKDYYSMHNPALTNPAFSDLRSTAHQHGSDPRQDFWTEWTSVRQSLQSWSFPPNPPYPPPSLATSHHPASDADRQDLLHISESFRYSALLYTERLASPTLPSSHSNIQPLVSSAIYHINNVKSDVFLLWPLFITGNECVDSSARQRIRERCWNLQRDSDFFNDISCLQLLEKMWRDDSPEVQCQSVRGEEQQPPAQLQHSVHATGLSPGEYSGNGFRWRKAMERVDGEFIVV